MELSFLDDEFRDKIGLEGSIQSIRLDGSINTKHGISGIYDTDIIKRIKQIIAKILTMIDNAVMTISISMKRIMETNLGFERRLKEMQSHHQVIKNYIKLSMYEYNIANLELNRKVLTKVVMELLKKTNNPSDLIYKTEEDKNVLLKGKSETELYIIHAIATQIPLMQQSIDINLAGTGANIKGYLNFVKSSFRGHKKNVLVGGSDASTFINIAFSIKGTGDMVMNQIKSMKAIVNKLKSNLHTSQSSIVNPEEKRKLATIVNSISAISNIYITFYRYYYNLRMEQAFVARDVVTKLYQMPKL